MADLNVNIRMVYHFWPCGLRWAVDSLAFNRKMRSPQCEQFSVGLVVKQSGIYHPQLFAQTKTKQHPRISG